MKRWNDAKELCEIELINLFSSIPFLTYPPSIELYR